MCNGKGYGEPLQDYALDLRFSKLVAIAQVAITIYAAHKGLDESRGNLTISQERALMVVCSLIRVSRSHDILVMYRVLC